MDAGTLIGQPQTLPQVIYIAGYGRSGSTLLDLLLGSHPLAFGAGELTEVFTEWQRDGRCSCGQRYAECAWWHSVLDRFQIALPGVSPREAEAVTRRVQSSLSPFGLGSRTPDHELYGRVWRVMLLSIGQESGRSVVVDSSKSSRDAARRIPALTRLAGVDVKVLHLVRDPRAVLWSAFRGSNRQLEDGRRVTLRGGAYRMLLGWVMANTSVHLSQAADSSLPIRRIRYEDMVSRPAQELRNLSPFLNLDLAPVVGLIENQHAINPGHGIGGNRMRRRGPIRIEPDDEWKLALPSSSRLLAVLAWPLARKYGYNVLQITS